MLKSEFSEQSWCYRIRFTGVAASWLKSDPRGLPACASGFTRCGIRVIAGWPVAVLVRQSPRAIPSLEGSALIAPRPDLRMA